MDAFRGERFFPDTQAAQKGLKFFRRQTIHALTAKGREKIPLNDIRIVINRGRLDVRCPVRKKGVKKLFRRQSAACLLPGDARESRKPLFPAVSVAFPIHIAIERSAVFLTPANIAPFPSSVLSFVDIFTFVWHPKFSSR